MSKLTSKTYSNVLSERIDILMGNLNEADAKRALLLDELAKSLNLQRLVPNVFARGSVSVRISGNVNIPTSMQFTITNGIGEEFHVPLLEVPETLWVHLKPKFRADCSKGTFSPREWRD